MMPRETEGVRTAIQLAIEIEPDLRLLKGLMTVLRYLGERSASDMIDPTAIAAIVLPAEEAIDRLIEIRRQSSTTSHQTKMSATGEPSRT